MESTAITTEKHELELVKKGDFRKECGPQPFMSVAPVRFYLTRPTITRKGESRTRNTRKNTLTTMPATWHNPFIWYVQQEMATVVIGSVDKEELAKVIGLPAKHIVIYTQPVGYKKK